MASGMSGASQDATRLGRAVGERGRPKRTGASGQECSGQDASVAKYVRPLTPEAQ